MMHSTETKGDTHTSWDLLPQDILEEILKKLKHLMHWRLFMSVCRTWRYVAINNKHKFIGLSRQRIPILLVPNLEKSKRNDAWSVYSVTNNKLLTSDLLLPPYDWPFAGSSEGWIGTLNKRLEVILYKPFDKSTRMLHLPALVPEENCLKHVAKRRQWWLMKFATFTPDPIKNPNDFICVIIFGSVCNLAYIRPSKDDKWSFVSSTTTGFDDVVYHNGKFYAVTCNGILVSVDVNDACSELRTKVVSTDVPTNSIEDNENEDEDEDEVEYVFLYKHYLVESHDGELLHIQRIVDGNSASKRNNLTIEFFVSKLCYDGAGTKWELLESLGHSALFLGENTSISVPVSNDCECQKNCIYFTHDKNTVSPSCQGPWDLGVYNLETKTVTRRFGIDETIFAKLGKRRSPIFALLP